MPVHKAQARLRRLRIAASPREQQQRPFLVQIHAERRGGRLIVVPEGSEAGRGRGWRRRPWKRGDPSPETFAIQDFLRFRRGNFPRPLEQREPVEFLPPVSVGPLPGAGPPLTKGLQRERNGGKMEETARGTFPGHRRGRAFFPAAEIFKVEAARCRFSVVREWRATWHSTKKERNRDKARERDAPALSYRYSITKRTFVKMCSLRFVDRFPSVRNERRKKRSSDRIDRLPVEERRGHEKRKGAVFLKSTSVSPK